MSSERRFGSLLGLLVEAEGELLDDNTDVLGVLGNEFCKRVDDPRTVRSLVVRIFSDHDVRLWVSLRGGIGGVHNLLNDAI